MNIGLKFAIVVQKDGLENEKEFVKAVESFGNTGLEVESDTIEFEDGEVVPVKIFYFKGNIVSYVRTKMELNCVESKEFGMWVLWPVDEIQR